MGFSQGKDARLLPSPSPAHRPPHHQDVLQEVQVAEGALRPVPQGSGAHLLTDVGVEGSLLEKERNVISRQENQAASGPGGQVVPYVLPVSTVGSLTSLCLAFSSAPGPDKSK